MTQTSGTKLDTITILVDSREQRPWAFDCPTETVTLDTADYSVKYLSHLIRIERKSLPDLVACIASGRDRFKRELERLRGFRFRALVVEASWEDIEKHQYRSNTHPASVTGSLISWEIDYDTPVWMLGTRKAAAAFAERWLGKCAARVISENMCIG